jgi:hypothetical protein
VNPDIRAFGCRLVDSLDLDPVYVALHRLRSVWGHERVKRWLMAYWCFYDSGFACYASQDEQNYPSRMRIAAENRQPSPLPGGKWPRAKERRHYRGQAAIDSMAVISELDVNRFFFELAESDTLPEFREKVERLPLFGPWISFKAADMMERVLGVPIPFDNAAVFMFKDPREAAIMLWRQQMDFPNDAFPKDLPAVLNGAVDYVLESLGDRKAPPSFDRRVNVQEAETVLCKWKSCVRGHYPDYNDLIEIRQGLDRWPQEIVHEFKEQFPRAPE